MQIMGFSPMVQGDPLEPLFMHKYIVFFFFFFNQKTPHDVVFFFFWFTAAQTTQGRLQPQHRHSGIVSDAGSGIAAAQGQCASMALQRRKQRRQ